MPGQPSADRPLCRDTTKTGTPCRNRAAAGSAYCGPHGGGKKRVGAPSKLDHATINTLVEALELGLTWEVAAATIGVHKSTLHGWRDKGAADLEAGKPTLYADLVDRLTRAVAVAELELVRTVKAHGPVDWRAAAWILERRHPDRWARRTSGGDNLETMEPRTVAPDAPARDAIVAILAKATAPPAGA
jgi:hypothetical protein